MNKNKKGNTSFQVDIVINDGEENIIDDDDEGG